MSSKTKVQPEEGKFDLGALHEAWLNFSSVFSRFNFSLNGIVHTLEKGGDGFSKVDGPAMISFLEANLADLNSAMGKLSDTI